MVLPPMGGEVQGWKPVEEAQRASPAAVVATTGAPTEPAGVKPPRAA